MRQQFLRAVKRHCQTRDASSVESRTFFRFLSAEKNSRREHDAFRREDAPTQELPAQA